MYRVGVQSWLERDIRSYNPIFEEKIASRDNRIVALERENRDLLMTVKFNQYRYMEMQEANSRNEELIESLKQEIVEKKESFSEAHNKLVSSFKLELVKMRDTESEKTTELKRAREEMGTLIDELKQKKCEMEEMASERKNFVDKSEVETLNESLRGKGVEFDELRERLKKSEAAIDDLRSVVVECTEEKKRLIAEMDSMKEKANSAEKLSTAVGQLEIKLQGSESEKKRMLARLLECQRKLHENLTNGGGGRSEEVKLKFEARVKEVEGELNSVRKENERLCASLEDKKKFAKVVKEKLSAVDVHVKRERDQHQKKVEKLEEKIRALTKKCNELKESQKGAGSLRKEQNDRAASRELSSAKEEIASLQDEVEDLKKKLSSGDKQSCTRQSELEKEHANEIDRIKTKLKKEHTNEVDSIKSKLEKEHRNEVARIKAKLEKEHADEIDRIKGKLEHASDELKEMRDEKVELKRMLRKVEDELEKERSAVKDSRKSKDNTDSLKEQVKTSKREIQQLEVKLKEQAVDNERKLKDLNKQLDEKSKQLTEAERAKKDKSRDSDESDSYDEDFDDDEKSEASVVSKSEASAVSKSYDDDDFEESIAESVKSATESEKSVAESEKSAKSTIASDEKISSSSSANLMANVQVLSEEDGEVCEEAVEDAPSSDSEFKANVLHFNLEAPIAIAQENEPIPTPEPAVKPAKPASFESLPRSKPTSFEPLSRSKPTPANETGLGRRRTGEKQEQSSGGIKTTNMLMESGGKQNKPLDVPTTPKPTKVTKFNELPSKSASAEPKKMKAKTTAADIFGSNPLGTRNSSSSTKSDPTRQSMTSVPSLELPGRTTPTTPPSQSKMGPLIPLGGTKKAPQKAAKPTKKKNAKKSSIITAADIFGPAPADFGTDDDDLVGNIDDILGAL